jgi:exodeoxyribonuclease VII small subunit
MTGADRAGYKATAGADRAGYEAMTFEDLVTTLEGLTDRMASGQIGIEEAADLYEQAELLHRVAAERLARVQARIEAHAARQEQGGEIEDR